MSMAWGSSSGFTVALWLWADYSMPSFLFLICKVMLAVLPHKVAMSMEWNKCALFHLALKEIKYCSAYYIASSHYPMPSLMVLACMAQEIVRGENKGDGSVPCRLRRQTPGAGRGVMRTSFNKKEAPDNDPWPWDVSITKIQVPWGQSCLLFSMLHEARHP